MGRGGNAHPNGQLYSALFESASGVDLIGPVRLALARWSDRPAETLVCSEASERVMLNHISFVLVKISLL